MLSWGGYIRLIYGNKRLRLYIHITREIFHHHPDGFINGLSKDGLASSFAVDQTGISKFFHVMGNCGKRDIKITRYIAYRWPFIFIQDCLSLAKTDILKNRQTSF